MEGGIEMRFGNMGISQREIAEAANVNRNTLAKHVHDLIKCFEEAGIDWKNLPDEVDE